MQRTIDGTHDAGLMSWVDSANDPATDYPIQNLPWCVFSRLDATAGPGVVHGSSSTSAREVGVLIGESVLSIDAIAPRFFGDIAMPRDGAGRIDAAALFGAHGRVLRERLSRLLRRDVGELRDDAALRERAMVERGGCEWHVPFACGDYTDFYASVYHATNVGSMFRPNQPLLPNYKHVPIGYHGRASSVVVSGTAVRRPTGQMSPAAGASEPTFGACQQLDYEMELGVVMGRGNVLGEPIGIAGAGEHAAGLCILNDWSARDVQRWEYQPLGPFLAKNFASSVSSCVVTMGALAPFRCEVARRGPGDPKPLAYLWDDEDQRLGGVDVTCEVWLASAAMRQRGIAAVRVSRGSARDLYWSVGQMIAHHASNGCNLRAGDLLGTGTISGMSRESRGCLLERTWDGDPWRAASAGGPLVVPGTQRTPIELPTGEKRVFLGDGDEVIMRAFCEREGFRRIGFGECRGIVVAAGER